MAPKASQFSVWLALIPAESPAIPLHGTAGVRVGRQSHYSTIPFSHNLQGFHESINHYYDSWCPSGKVFVGKRKRKKKNVHLSKGDRPFHSREREVKCKSDTILFKHPITKITVHLYKTELQDLSLSARLMYLPWSQRCNELRKHLGDRICCKGFQPQSIMPGVLPMALNSCRKRCWGGTGWLFLSPLLLHSHPEAWGNFNITTAGLGPAALLRIVFKIHLWHVTLWPLVADAGWLHSLCGNSWHQ